MKKNFLLLFIIFSLFCFVSCKKTKALVTCKVQEEKQFTYEGDPNKDENTKEATIVVSLDGAVFSKSAREEEASSFFSTILIGLSYTYSTTAGEKDITFKIKGTPLEWSDDNFNISISKDLLKIDEDREMKEEKLEIKAGSYKISFTNVAAYYIASYSDINYNGTLGSDTVNSTIKVFLSNASFKAIAEDTDVSNWFSQTDSQLKYTLIKNDKKSNEININITGRPTGDSNKSFNLTIPLSFMEANLSFKLPDKDMVLTEGKYNITTKNVFAELKDEDNTSYEFDGNWANLENLNKEIIIKLTNGTFKNIENKGNNCKTWLSKTTPGVVYTFEANEGSSEGVLTISNYPYIEEEGEFSISIPKEYINILGNKSIPDNLTIQEKIKYTYKNLKEIKIEITPEDRAILTISKSSETWSLSKANLFPLTITGGTFNITLNNVFDIIYSDPGYVSTMNLQVDVSETKDKSINLYIKDNSSSYKGVYNMSSVNSAYSIRFEESDFVPDLGYKYNRTYNSDGSLALEGYIDVRLGTYTVVK